VNLEEANGRSEIVEREDDMKCMTDTEFAAWLSGFGSALDENNNPKFAGSDGGSILLAYVPKDASRLYHFAAWLIRWLPASQDRVLWLKHWTAMPDQEALFEQLRHEHGERQPIGTAPAHLFGSIESRGTQVEVREEATLLGMILLIMAFDWKAYGLADKHVEYFYRTCARRVTSGRHTASRSCVRRLTD
jgi:hypothetical protein